MKLKLPYSQLIEYCIFDKQKDKDISAWFNDKLHLPVDDFVVHQIRERVRLPKSKKNKAYKEMLEYRKDLVAYVNDKFEVVEAISSGFSKPEIFKDLVALLSSVDIDKEMAFALINRKHRVDLTDYSELIDVIFYTEKWSVMDWHNYLKYLEDIKAFTFKSSLDEARFTSKNELMYKLGVGSGTLEDGIKMAADKANKMFLNIDSNTRADTIRSIVEGFGKTSTIYFNMKKEGMLENSEDSVGNLSFAIHKSKFEKIESPKFENLDDDDEYIGG